MYNLSKPTEDSIRTANFKYITYNTLLNNIIEEQIHQLQEKKQRQNGKINFIFPNKKLPILIGSLIQD